ncbi:hypothetical protein Tco_0809469 [Tanacetum coccineum]
MNTKLVGGSEVREECGKTREESSSKRAGDVLEQEPSKKQKMEDDKETTELQTMMEVIPDEEEVAIDVIPLATKPPSIVDCKIIKERKISYYQIIRADGNSKRYSSMIQMLKSFDREDLETLLGSMAAPLGSGSAKNKVRFFGLLYKGNWLLVVNLAHCSRQGICTEDDTPVLIHFRIYEGLEDCLELKDATACHLKISAITPPAWKGFLDNHLDVDLLDLYDRCYARQAVVDNEMNRRSRELLEVIEKLRGEADVMRARVLATRRRGEGLSRPSLVGKLVSSVLPSAGAGPMNSFAVKEAPTLQKPIPSSTQMHVPSSQLATSSYVPSLKPISPPANIVKPSPSPNDYRHHVYN